MSVIRVVWGTAAGPTGTAAYDAALADAGVENYNLVPLSSILPADASLAVVGTAPDLGAAGNGLYVVQGRAPAGPDETAAAGIGWARSESGRGVFYEAAGGTERAVRTEIEAGLAAGRDLREWTFVEEETVVRRVEGPPDERACAVVLAAFGESRPLL
ncbi:pyruvoyl-dependent arginine decarboxylase [Halobacteriales archaeon QS_1_68_17]|nr:MAG: pyruvoyl-dependent arginine decarboxylase [Halobacteriales archaeon QS_1_68_17]